MPKDAFSWLHLTDFHYGLKGQDCLWPTLREPFLESLGRLHERCGPWDVVFFTGDLVQSGSAEQFAEMQAQVLEPLWQRLTELGSGDAVLLAVPGNHDLVRPGADGDDPALDNLLDESGFSRIEDKFWGQPTGGYRKVVDRAFEHYSAWWSKVPRRAGSVKDGILPGDFSATIACGGRRIGVIGLNTAFLQLAGGDYTGRLCWSPHQIKAVCGEKGVDDWSRQHDVSLLLSHHGPDWLTEQAREDGAREIAPAKRFAVHLFGHQHESHIEYIQYGGSSHAVRRCQSNSLFGMEKVGDPPKMQRAHGYMAGRIEFTDDQAALRLWPCIAIQGKDGWRYAPDHQGASLVESGDDGTQPQAVFARPGAAKRPAVQDKGPQAAEPEDVVADRASPQAAPLDEFPMYVGLRPYRRKDAPYFFGREAEVGEYLKAIASVEHQTLLLKGWSGVGKSSLMFAGVLPRLPGTPVSKPRNYLYLTPGADPFLSLAQAINQRRTSSQRVPQAEVSRCADRLGKSPEAFVRALEEDIVSTHKRVLYIDQLEELLIETHSAESHSADKSTRRKLAFVKSLKCFLDHDPRRNFLVASIREDYAGKMNDEAWAPLTVLFERGMVRWLRLPEHEATIDQIVAGPCQRAGFAVEPQLLAALRADIKGLKGWPPLLSACLEDMVNLVRASPSAMAERRLTLDHYQRVGGLSGIVLRRVQYTESALSREARHLLPELFERLVRIDHATGNPTKDRFILSTLPPALRAVADLLLSEEHRLLADEGKVEFIHDALFDGWPRLQNWISANREQLLDNIDFKARAEIWNKLRRPTRKLARDDDLMPSFGESRAKALMASDANVKAWAEASAHDELYKHLGRTMADPDIWRLPRLVSTGTRLDEESVKKLGPEFAPFYYALCPDALPKPASEDKPAGAPTDSSAEGALTDHFAASQQAQPQSAQSGLGYFEASHLELTAGRRAQFRVQHYAALGGNVHVLKRLHDLGADLDLSSNDFQKPLVLAAFNGSLEAVHYLLSISPDPAASVVTKSKLYQRHSVHQGVFSGDPEVVKALLETLPPGCPYDTPDDEGWTPLLIAAYLGNCEVARQLLAFKGADLGATVTEGYGVMQVAIGHRRWPFVRMLMDTEHAARLSVDGGRDEHHFEAPLCRLIYAWDGAMDEADRAEIEAIFQALIDQGADPSLRVGEHAQPLLSVAAGRGAEPLMAMLMPLVDVNAADAQGWTALNHALGNRHEACALRLLDQLDEEPV